MLVKHPLIYLDAAGTMTDALLIEGGRVVATGCAALEHGNGHDVVEPDGACVFPGLTDAHIHLWGLGLRAGAVSLRAAASTADVYRAVDSYAISSSPSGWVLGKGWDQHAWRDTDALDIARLDAAWPDTPVMLRRVDSHALWVNSETLRRAGISESFDSGVGGHVGRTDGRLNGLLVDDAMHPVLDIVPEPGAAEDEATFLESCGRLRSLGITSAHKAWMPVDRFDMLVALKDREALPIRLHLLFDGNDANLDRMLERGPRQDDWISATGIKFFADGALGSQGALLLDTYADGTCGLEVDDRLTLLKRVPELAEAGWQVAIHAIGDAGARNVLDAYAAIPPATRAITRPRLEHAQMMSDEDVARMGTLGVIASIQPIHMYSDGTWVENALSDAQVSRLFRWRDLQAVTRLCAGSDYPIEDVNPWHSIATGLTRKDRDGRVFRADQALTIHELLDAYTHQAAWASGWEDWLGQLHPGFAADFISLEHDPFKATPDQLWEQRVLGTWVNAQA